MCLASGRAESLANVRFDGVWIERLERVFDALPFACVELMFEATPSPTHFHEWVEISISGTHGNQRTLHLRARVARWYLRATDATSLSLRGVGECEVGLWCPLGRNDTPSEGFDMCSAHSCRTHVRKPDGAVAFRPMRWSSGRKRWSPRRGRRRLLPPAGPPEATYRPQNVQYGWQ